MIYDFYSRNSNLHFRIDGDDEFKLFCDFLEDSLDEESMRSEISKLRKYNQVRVDKEDTIFMCRELEYYMNSREMFDDINDTLNNFRHEGILLVTIYLVQFINFIKRTRGGFVIYRREK